MSVSLTTEITEKAQRTTELLNAAERQGDKAWGFKPQVAIAVNFCALKGRGEADTPPSTPSGRKN
ncbi:MAG: hypothetical protein GY795_32590 [Desulfobacterales bacterium]|nr:hypothetical protein [Desulfobacterales bacterium]